MSSKINPEWQRYNDVYNEGGEGYNPHPKYVAAVSVTATVAIKTAAAAARVLKDERGNYIGADKLKARMDRDIARLSKITDPSARAITQAAIDFAAAQLA